MNKIFIFVAFATIFGYATSAVSEVVAPQQDDNPLTVEERKQEKYFEIGEEEQDNEPRSAPLVLPKEISEGLDAIESTERARCSGCRSYCQRRGKNGWACYNGYCTCF